VNTLRWLVACSALVVISAPGCKRARQKAFEESAEQATGAEKVHVSEDGKRVTLSTSDDGGEAEIEMGGSARIPADFPKAVPIYPGSKIVAAVGSTDKGKRSHIVTLAAPAAANTVYDFYKQRLPSFGKVEEVGLGGIRMLSAKDGKGTTVSVMVSGNGANASTVQLTANAS
jgi:hypothetical protein